MVKTIVSKQITIEIKLTEKFVENHLQIVTCGVGFFHFEYIYFD